MLSVRTSLRSAAGSDALSASAGLAMVESEDLGFRLTLTSSLAKASGRRSRDPQTIET